MIYVLKQFDIALIKFELTVTVIEGLTVNIIELYHENQSSLPLDLQVSNQGLLKWLKRRTIPKNRAFVQQFLAKLGLDVNDTKGIIDICKGLSLNDCYWIVEENFQGSFAAYNLYDNRFNRALALLAYTGYGSIQPNNFVSTPELTTDGMLAKCWRRVQGKIVLYKAGTSGYKRVQAGQPIRAKNRFLRVAKTMGLPTVQYNLSRWKGKHTEKQLFSTCELFTSKEIAYIQTSRLVTEGSWLAVFAYYQQLGERYLLSSLTGYANFGCGYL